MLDLTKRVDTLIADTNKCFIGVNADVLELWATLHEVNARCTELEQEMARLKDVPATPKVDSWGYYIQ